MKIKNYVWDIFEIGNKNDVDIGVALDMFLTNCEEGFSKYEGADDVDYQALKKEWTAMTDTEKSALKNEYHKITDDNYAELTAARREKDKEKFESILNGAVEQK